MSSPLDGLASGLSTTALINQLIQLERAPQTRLIQKKARSDAIVKAIQGINSKLSALRTAAQFRADPDRWNVKKATSSDTAVATATATDAAALGSLTFTVANLATAGGMASAGTVSSLSESLTSGALLFPDSTASALGIAQLSGTGLASGEHTIEVTQASAAAVYTGTDALVSPTVIANGGNALTVVVNGVTQNITLTNGTYNTPAEMIAELQTQLGSDVVVGTDGGGALTLTTVREGSLATIQITGGNARNTLGLGIDNTTYAGTDAILTVDGTVQTITSLTDGETINLTSGTGGTFGAEIDGGLRAGSWTGNSIDSGDGSLQDIIDSINDADVGVSAAAVQVSPGQYRLQLTATETGVENDIAFAADIFAGTSLGSLLRTSDALDATITIGDGPGAYNVTSASNTVDDMLVGVTLTLKTTGTTTVDVTRDAEALAKDLEGLVTAANAALADIKAQTSFNAETKVGGLLMGTLAVRNLQTKIIDAVVNPVSTSALASASLAGVSTTKDGTLAFDKAKFLAAFEDDPDAVAALFRQGGKASDGDVAFVSSTDRTQAGTYAVDITTVAEKATVTGLTAPTGSVIALAETIDVRVGSTEISFAAQAGDSLTVIADGLNALLAAEDMNVEATVESGRLVLRTTSYGTSATFDVRSSLDDGDADQTGIVDVAGAWETHTGVNVAGTINGVAATGKGQFLTAPADDSDLAGLVLAVTATVIGAQGTFEYVPGVAQRIASIANDAIDTVTGSLTALIEGRQTEMRNFDDQILRWETRIGMRELQLRKQFTAMELALQRAQGQMQWLSGIISGMQANNNNGR